MSWTHSAEITCSSPSNVTVDSGNIIVDDGNVTVDGGNIVVDSGNIVIDSGNVTSTELMLAAVRAGNGVMRWVNDVTPGAAQIVLTNGPAAGGQPGIYYNLPEGRQVLITMFCFGVNTLNDDCHFEFGWTDAVNGGGTFTPVTSHLEATTGAAREGRSTFDKIYNPPILLKYSNGVRSITARVNANDAGCAITLAWHGWTEDET